MSAPYRYLVYGHGLDSSMAFPELPATRRASRWRFEGVPSLPPMRDATLLGADPLYGDVTALLYAHAEGHRIAVDDTGEFDLDRDRRGVTWGERAEAWPDFVRAHLTGRVLATALWLDGLLPLHASAVATREGVLAFLAPKGYGKSSLALALATAGATLITDDTLPLEPGDPPTAWPGVTGLRVHDDALAALGAARPALTTREGKRIVTTVGGGEPVTAPTALAAIYLLAPVPAEVRAVTRETLAPPIGAIATVAHVKAGRMLGAGAAPAMLARAAAVVRRVPVHRLYAPRDLARLDETAETLLRWHGGAAR